MSGRHTSRDPSHQPRRDSMYEPHIKDPYLERGKWAEPTVCPDCGAIFHQGRWQWGEAPADAAQHRCPACSRIHDRVPAAILTLSGDFLQTHREEIMNLVRNYELREKDEHPLERIMAIEETPDGQTQITFTSNHLANAIGRTLHDAYEGEYDFAFTDSDAVFRASWTR